MPLIHPIIMSGGAGTRLWPLSRSLYPKQFLKLAGPQTLLQDAVGRVDNKNIFAPPLVICAEEHRFLIAEQIRELGIKPAAILLEPTARNTSAVAALAALYLRKHSGEDNPLFLLMPTDHAIGDVQAFQHTCTEAARAAEQGYLVTFGITPEKAETGYGYLAAGAALGAGPVRKVDAFIEKPDAAAAEDYVRRGYFWNSGMFVFAAQTVLAEFEKFQPEILACVTAAFDKAVGDLDFVRLDADAFTKTPSLSIDYGVMEKTDKAAIVPANLKWSDIGSWQSLWELSVKDGRGNAVTGDVMAVDTHNSCLRADGKLLVTLGLSNMLVAAEDDVVLVADITRAQEVKGLVEKLKEKGREEIKNARRVYRPWGWYESLGAGERFQVKRIMVKAGAKLSLQKHHHRSEHWVVVSGAALVTRNRDELFVYENQSVYLPAGCEHRLENQGKVPLLVIEVQSGSYLGEDDIVRIEDSYGRH